MNVSVLKPIIICMASIFAASCASNSTQVVKRNDTVTDDKPVTANACESIVRNLSLPWSSSQAGCAENRNTNVATKPVKKEEGKKSIDKQMERNERLLAKRKEREKAAVMYKAEVLASRIVKAESVDQAEHVIDSENVSGLTPGHIQELGTEPRLIWFAKHLRILGPKGREYTESLVPKLQADQKAITLRGYYLADEVKGCDPEVYSVARALAVKKKLVQFGNISPDRITILHHAPDVNGRYVEVTFNG